MLTSCNPNFDCHHHGTTSDDDKSDGCDCICDQGFTIENNCKDLIGNFLPPKDFQKQFLK